MIMSDLSKYVHCRAPPFGSAHLHSLLPHLLFLPLAIESLPCLLELLPAVLQNCFSFVGKHGFWSGKRFVESGRGAVVVGADFDGEGRSKDWALFAASLFLHFVLVNQGVSCFRGCFNILC